MKVLIVGNDPSVKGGITSVIQQILSYDWLSQGIEMSFIPTYAGGNSIHKILFFVKAYFRIQNTIRRNKPDTVHIHMSYKGSFYRKFIIHHLCQKHGIPDIIHLHGSEFQKWYDGSTEKTRKKIRILLRECKAFIVLGEKWNAIVKKIEPRTNTIVIRNTVRIPEKTVSWAHPLRVLYLGMLIERKGVSDLLKAIKRLSEDASSEEVQFDIAGSGPEGPKLQQECKELGIEQYVHFAGWVDGEAKARLMEKSQILVLPSYNEGLPISVLEAISYGMPVISTDVGDIASAVKNEWNGYLIEPGDYEAMKNKLLCILHNEEQYSLMSGHSRKLAEEAFSDEAYFDRLTALYRKTVIGKD